MKMLFIGKNQIGEYDENQRDLIEKFLYYQNSKGEGLLLLGEKGLMHSEIEELAKESTEIDMSDNKLLGAGTCDRNGITGWESKGYKIQTPMRIRLMILPVLQTTDN